MPRGVDPGRVRNTRADRHTSTNGSERISNSSLLSRVLRAWCSGARWFPCSREGAVGSSVGSGPGVADPKSRPSGCEVDHAGLKSRPWLPSRARQCQGVSEELSVNSVGDAPLERTHSFFLRFGFGDLALEERAPWGVREADLGDRGDVEGVVQLPVAASREPMSDPPT